MQVVACERALALRKLGMTIALNNAMIATTIMISTNVNAARWFILVFITLCLCGANTRQAVILFMYL